MCLAVPMKVVEINGNMAKVELSGTFRMIGLDIIDSLPEVGDYVDQMGDKIWLVKTDDITSGNLTGWNPAEYLFESALINTP